MMAQVTRVAWCDVRPIPRCIAPSICCGVSKPVSHTSSCIAWAPACAAPGLERALSTCLAYRLGGCLGQWHAHVHVARPGGSSLACGHSGRRRAQLDGRHGSGSCAARAGYPHCIPRVPYSRGERACVLDRGNHCMLSSSLKSR